jgi:hypothetical protein
VKVLRYI